MKLLRKKWLYYPLSICLVCLITTGVWFYTRGIPLCGLPKPEDISYVEIRDTRLPNDGTRELTQPREIEDARNVSNFLSYELGEAQGEPFLFLTYHLQNGEVTEVSANEDTVFWKGKAHRLKERELFCNVVEGLFFPGAE